MAKELTIGNNTYNYPENGENPGWGEEATAWAEAVTDLLATVQGANDITLSNFTLQNNQITAANITGLAFNLTEVLQFRIEYTIKRTNDGGSTITTETGTIYGHNNDTVVELSQEFTGNTGIDFSITPAGQLQYTSSNLVNHVSSSITFKATAMNK